MAFIPVVKQYITVAAQGREAADLMVARKLRWAFWSGKVWKESLHLPMGSNPCSYFLRLITIPIPLINRAGLTPIDGPGHSRPGGPQLPKHNEPCTNA